MTEYQLLKLWNQKRVQLISAQVAPAAVLAVITVLAVQGRFTDALSSTKYLAIAVAGVTGFLAIITQFAIIRESEALVADLKKIENPSMLAKKVASSRDFLSLTATAITGLGILNFGLVVLAVLSRSL